MKKITWDYIYRKLGLFIVVALVIVLLSSVTAFVSLCWKLVVWSWQ